jgi:hypothetical protein
MPQTITRYLLRAAARKAVEDHVGPTHIKKVPTVAKGARLEAKTATGTIEIAVRTSLEREVGLMRDRKGRWRTVRKVDLVVVAVRADGQDAAEVFAFERDVLIEAFDAALKAQRSQISSSYEAPTFIALDPTKRARSTSLSTGLKAKAKWRALVPIDSTLAIEPVATETIDQFVNRVKLEFATLVGVDAVKVAVEFRIAT